MLFGNIGNTIAIYQQPKSIVQTNYFFWIWLWPP